MCQICFFCCLSDLLFSQSPRLTLVGLRFHHLLQQDEKMKKQQTTKKSNKQKKKKRLQLSAVPCSSGSHHGSMSDCHLQAMNRTARQARRTDLCEWNQTLVYRAAFIKWEHSRGQNSNEPEVWNPGRGCEKTRKHVGSGADLIHKEPIMESVSSSDAAPLQTSGALVMWSISVLRRAALLSWQVWV